MKIAFWSEQKGADTSFHLAVTACACALLHSISVAAVPGGYHDEELERKFFQPSGGKPGIGERAVFHGHEQILAAESQEYFLSGGLECLLCKERREDLTEAVVKANMRQVIRDRMYCLPASAGREQEWWYKDPLFVRMGRVIDAVDAYFDVVFIDCGDRRDDCAQKILSESDVCVLNMRQETEGIGEFYRSPPRIRGKIFFLLGDYFENAPYNLENLRRLYRVEEGRLGAIPYNPRLEAAGQMGRIASGVRNSIGREARARDAAFEKELVRTANLILKLAGVIA